MELVDLLRQFGAQQLATTPFEKRLVQFGQESAELSLVGLRRQAAQLGALLLRVFSHGALFVLSNAAVQRRAPRSGDRPPGTTGWAAPARTLLELHVVGGPRDNPRTSVSGRVNDKRKAMFAKRANSYPCDDRLAALLCRGQKLKEAPTECAVLKRFVASFVANADVYIPFVWNVAEDAQAAANRGIGALTLGIADDVEFAVKPDADLKEGLFIPSLRPTPNEVPKMVIAWRAAGSVLRDSCMGAAEKEGGNGKSRHVPESIM